MDADSIESGSGDTESLISSAIRSVEEEEAEEDDDDGDGTLEIIAGGSERVE